MTGYVSANGHKTRHQSEGIVPLRGDGADAALWKIKKIGVVKVNGVSWAKNGAKNDQFLPYFSPLFIDA